MKNKRMFADVVACCCCLEIFIILFRRQCCEVFTMQSTARKGTTVIDQMKSATALPCGNTHNVTQTVETHI